MSAYIIAELEVHDPDGFSQYARPVPEIITAHGGEILAAGEATVDLEGDSSAGHRFVVLRFPDTQRARAWWESPEYQAVIGLRRRNSTGRFVLVEGVEPS